LRGEAVRNQNQIATMLGFDRTVVHRAIKAMVREGLVSEKKAKSGKAILRLVEARRDAERKLRRKLTAEDCDALIRHLGVIAELEL
jgi:DNA-binding MarR family transcriptional regulator